MIVINANEHLYTKNPNSQIMDQYDYESLCSLYPPSHSMLKELLFLGEKDLFWVGRGFSDTVKDHIDRVMVGYK